MITTTGAPVTGDHVHVCAASYNVARVNVGPAPLQATIATTKEKIIYLTPAALMHARARAILTANTAAWRANSSCSARPRILVFLGVRVIAEEAGAGRKSSGVPQPGIMLWKKKRQARQNQGSTD